jgi:YegS/Rv2252/BmrU family lipid kinase
LLLNVRARRGFGTEAAVLRALRTHGIEPSHMAKVWRPRGIGKAVDALLAKGVDRLIVGGGDGTLGSVAARLAHRPIVLGVMPLGTANDFARTLGIPWDIEGSAEVIAQGQVRRIDLGRANDAYFLNVASIGMSVSAVSELSEWVKRWFGPIAYLYAGARAFGRHSTFWVRVQNGPDSIETSAHQIVVGNGRFYGGGLLVARQSSLEDGMLHAYALGTRGRWQLLRTVALLRLGVATDRPGDHFLTTNALQVETRPKLAVNCDGEIRTMTPVTFAVEPGALQVFAPG